MHEMQKKQAMETCDYNNSSSSGDDTVKREYFTLREILPLSTTSFAPDTTQYPGMSCGPLVISVVSTNFSSLGAWTGTGGPPGYTAELMFTSFGRGGGFRPCVKWPLINNEMIPDF
eukprot:TRINITY_DN3272_c0_g2_i1.p1 TRINITY_DN3272_c0_g2~~TRINITY_DN3272_c0_g2_i1.p1  ORF type:complete len:116 (-),score=18.66 TRINITY_DN3272_c0_g2_i1:1714-2061(-)